MLGVFLGALDISIVSPALPNIARDLNAQGLGLSWIITFYTLVYVLAVPLMSSLSDRWGRKRVLLANIVLFGLGSLYAAFSHTIVHLLIARGVQAFGAGGLFPIASTVVGEEFPSERQGMALGFIGMVWGVAAIIGPLIGGWITQWFSWQAIFYVSTALSFLTLIMAWKTLPPSTSLHHSPFDWPGTIFLGAGLLPLVYVLSSLKDTAVWHSLITPPNGYLLLLSIAALTIFFFLERRAAAPVIPVQFFKKRAINISTALSFARGMTEAGIAFLPFYAIAVLGIDPGAAGTLIIATAVTMFLLTEPAGFLVDKIGPKIVLIFGGTMTALGAFLMIYANSILTFILYQIIMGTGLSALSGAPVRYVVLRATKDTQKASAQGVVSLASSFGIMVGSALAGSFLATGSGVQTPPISAFHNIYLSVATVAVIAAILPLALRPR